MITAVANRFARTITATAGAVAAATLFVGAAVLPAPAHAAQAGPAATARIVYAMDADGRRTAEVRYGDLDLGSDAGRATLERRLRTAARQVCNADVDDVVAQADQQRCRSEAMAATRRAVAVAIDAERRAG
jgi:UrcA family protein